MTAMVYISETYTYSLNVCGAQEINNTTASAAPAAPRAVPLDSHPSSASGSRASSHTAGNSHQLSALLDSNPSSASGSRAISHKDESSRQLSVVLQEGRRKEARIVIATAPLICQAGTMTEDVFVGQLPSATAPARLESGGNNNGDYDSSDRSRQFQGSASLKLPALRPLTLPQLRSYCRVRTLTPTIPHTDLGTVTHQ